MSDIKEGDWVTCKWWFPRRLVRVDRIDHHGFVFFDGVVGGFQPESCEPADPLLVAIREATGPAGSCSTP